MCGGALEFRGKSHPEKIRELLQLRKSVTEIRGTRGEKKVQEPNKIQFDKRGESKPGSWKHDYVQPFNGQRGRKPAASVAVGKEKGISIAPPPLAPPPLPKAPLLCSMA